MQKYWAWLGLNLGKHAGRRVDRRARRSRSCSASASRSSSSPPARTATSTRTRRSTRTASPTRTCSAARPWSRSSRSARARTLTDLFTPEAVEAVGGASRPRSRRRAATTSSRVVTPAHRPAVHQRPRAARRPGTSWRAWPPRSSSAPPSATPREEGKAIRSASPRSRPSTRVNAIPPEDRVIGNEAWNDFLLHDNEGEIRKSLRPFFPNEAQRPDGRAAPGQPRHRDRGRRRPSSWRTPPPTSSFGDATVSTTGAAVLLRDLNDYLTGGMLVLGAIAVGLMVIILLVAFDVRWRLLPLGRRAGRRASGPSGWPATSGIPLTVVTIAGLPVMLGVGIDYAIQMHARIEEEVVIDRAEHPIQETAREPRTGPARRHLRRHLRLPRPALRQGADDPRLRPAARGRRRGDLPVQHRRPARRPRHPRVQVADHRQGLPRRACSAGWW